jgi:flagellar biosynthesis protein FliQ
MNEFNMILDPLRAFLVQTASYLPRLAVALVILIAGWLLAKAIRFGVVKTLRALNFHVLTERAGVDAFLQQGGTTKDTADVVGVLVYWAVILAALIIAFNGLGLTQVTDLLSRVLLFLPKLLVALVVIIIGSYFGRFVGQSVLTYCRNVGISDAELLGKIAQYAIVIFVVLIAVDQLDIGGALVQNTFLILLAGLVFGLALAFGLGGRDWAAAMLERWWPRDRGDRL